MILTAAYAALYRHVHCRPSRLPLPPHGSKKKYLLQRSLMPLRARLPIRAMSTSPFAAKPDEKLTLSSTVTLQDGKQHPRFGIGAWLMRGNDATQSLQHAVDQVGYRLIDTAKYYRNEAEVGKAICQSTVPRKDIYAVTKLFTNDMGGGSRTKSAYEDSLSKSGLDYWDLVLLHAPDGGKDFRLKTWETLALYVQAGQIKSLGVSNFGEHHIEELVNSPQGKAVKPVVNQIECHPFFAQKALRAKCEQHGILVQAYCPLARGRYYGDKTLQQVAKRNNCTEAQVMLSWSIHHGIVPLPKSSNAKRQAENAESLHVRLSEEDIQGEFTRHMKSLFLTCCKALDRLDRGDAGAIEMQTSSQSAP